MIAIDAMGGDNAPLSIIQGALNAAREGFEIILTGPLERLEAMLDSLDGGWRSYPLHIHHAPDSIEMDEEPVAAVKKKQQSSLVEAVKLVASGKATHVISAGSSGALVVASLFILGRLPDCDRPAIAGFLPTPKGSVLALDLGANTDVRPHHLLQFATVGAHYFEQLTQKKQPRVALLANGHEAGKGSMLVKEAHALLAQSPLNFVGNAEPYHVFNAEMDIIVCDGFTGNIMLKTMEAVYQAGAEILVKEASLSQKGIDALNQRVDPRQMGGALLLGVKGNVIVCHGSSDAFAIRNAVALAVRGFAEVAQQSSL